MNLITNDLTYLHLKLSRRNLLTLLKLLDEKVDEPFLTRIQGHTQIVVTAEEDQDHYTSTERDVRSRGGMGIGPDDVKRDGFGRLV